MIRVGHGIDVHPFDEARPLVLGGVRVADSGGLAGHSDADVVLHALTDALLGAAGAGDIGDHFPSTDERWRGAESSRFLREALRIVTESDFAIANVDITIIAEKPRIGPHKEALRHSIASILSIPPGSVNVKATTTDHLGFVGRGEGICAFATAALERAVPETTLT